MKSKSYRILALDPGRHDDFRAHMDRHIAESGRDGIHFMPFSPAGPDRPNGVAADKLGLRVDEKGWQRCWVAEEEDSGLFVGHVDLKGSHLRAALHRCELGLGVEEPYRREGLGRSLMQTAIAFARAQPQLAWIDLNTFIGNVPAQKLYRQLGFIEVARFHDRFRIDGVSLDDIVMTLPVSK